MKFFRKTVLSTTLCILILSTNSSAQLNLPAYELGINIGTLVYQGDLTPNFYGHLRSLHPAIGINLTKSLGPYFFLRASLLRGKLSVDESIYTAPDWRQYRGLRFTSPITELSSSIIFKPLSNNLGEYGGRWSPYLFAGAGFTFLNVKRSWNNFSTNFFNSRTPAAVGLGIDTLTPIPKIIPVMPVGAGAGYVLSQRLSITAEATYRITASDYMDGFKYAGFAKSKDAYYGVTLGLTYRLGTNKYKCPSVR